MKHLMILELVMFNELMTRADELEYEYVNINVHYIKDNVIKFEIDDNDLSYLFYRTFDFMLPEMEDYTYEDFLLDNGVQPL
jgi:hypothetical protein